VPVRDTKGEDLFTRLGNLFEAESVSDDRSPEFKEEAPPLKHCEENGK
jgi:hypothetical protein